jgi:phosphohistidine phosphatase
MELYILRHAIAVERGTPGYENDFERPLTAEGEEKLRRIARAMCALDLSFDLILSSPFVRARQTAERVAAVLKHRKGLELRDSLGADSDPRAFVAELKASGSTLERLLLVGHEPFLSSLVALLTTGTLKSCVVLKKAGLCKLTVTSLRVGRCATLEWLLTPRHMLLM